MDRRKFGEPDAFDTSTGVDYEFKTRIDLPDDDNRQLKYYALAMMYGDSKRQAELYTKHLRLKMFFVLLLFASCCLFTATVAFIAWRAGLAWWFILGS